MSGLATQTPARSIAPWDAPTWADVEKIFADAIKTADPSTPLLFAGFDALLHQRPSPRPTNSTGSSATGSRSSPTTPGTGRTSTPR